MSGSWYCIFKYLSSTKITSLVRHGEGEGVHERGAGEAPVGAHRVGTHEDAELPGHVLDSLLLPRLVLGLQGPPDV